MDDSIELKDVVDLGVCLRTRPFEYVLSYFDVIAVAEIGSDILSHPWSLAGGSRSS